MVRLLLNYKNMEVKLGDKLWMHYGPNTLLVGHVVDQSPDQRHVAVSPLPFDEYHKMTQLEKAGCPISWCEVKFCHYLCHTAYEDLKKQDEAISNKPAGFRFLP